MRRLSAHTTGALWPSRQRQVIVKQARACHRAPSNPTSGESELKHDHGGALTAAKCRQSPSESWIKRRCLHDNRCCARYYSAPSCKVSSGDRLSSRESARGSGFFVAVLSSECLDWSRASIAGLSLNDCSHAHRDAHRIGARWLYRSPRSTIDSSKTIVWSGQSILDVSDDPTAVDSALFILPTIGNGHDHCRGIANISFGATDQALELWLPSMYAAPIADPYLVAAVAYGRMVRSGIGSTVHFHVPQALQELSKRQRLALEQPERWALGSISACPCAIAIV